MINPFEIISERLSNIEMLLLDLKHKGGSADYPLSSKSQYSKGEEPIRMEDVSRLLQVSDTTVRDWIRKGALPCHRKGRRVYFFKSEVLKSLEQPLDNRKGGKR
jgi:excisionase family DNA binding protein